MQVAVSSLSDLKVYLPNPPTIPSIEIAARGVVGEDMILHCGVMTLTETTSCWDLFRQS